MSSIAEILTALDRADNAALAIISNVVGPSYRPLGAMMAIGADGQTTGMLSSGCIESDVVQHALEALKNQAPKTLLYGEGSPFFDIQLPCGGGLEICVIPNPDPAIIQTLRHQHSARQSCTFQIDLNSGQIDITQGQTTERQGQHLTVCLTPPLRFLVFGKGPEAATFASLLAASGYDHLLVSHEEETLDLAKHHGANICLSHALKAPSDYQIDQRSAVVLFFHDHELEPPILAQALKTPAFYIGAQGSLRARERRDAALLELDPKADVTRTRGPIGLIASARDPQTLSVSVLAEILALARP